jgi:biopolymer transport protein ExbB
LQRPESNSQLRELVFLYQSGEKNMELIFKKLALVGDIWVLWILMGASVVSLGVVFERWWMFRKNKNDFASLLDQLANHFDKNDAVGARKLARSIASVEARVALAGLINFGKGPASVEEAMTSRIVIERSSLEKNLVVLGTLGNNAPFIGLFGTVLGIIKAFNDLAMTGTSGVSVVMSGISSALIATAFGIFVAIPAVMANNYFQTRLRRTIANSQSLIHMFQIYLKDQAHQELGHPLVTNTRSRELEGVR